MEKERAPCKIICLIVCPAACRSCDITPCADRMADEETEEKLHIAAAQAAAMTSTELYEFWDGRKGGKGTTILHIYEDEIAEPRTQEAMAKVMALEGLKHCGMRDIIACAYCHETDCKIRLAPRRF